MCALNRGQRTTVSGKLNIVLSNYAITQQRSYRFCRPRSLICTVIRGKVGVSRKRCCQRDGESGEINDYFWSNQVKRNFMIHKTTHICAVFS